MAALTAASTQRESAGSMTLMSYRFTSMADSDTFSSGLGANVVDSMYWLSCQANTSTQTSGGGNVTYSSTTGIFTFYPSEDSNAGTLMVFTRT